MQELNQGELRTLIAEAVSRGALKAIAVATLVSALVGFLLYILHIS